MVETPRAVIKFQKCNLEIKIMNGEVDQTANLRNDLQEWSKKMQSGYAELGQFIVEFSQLEFSIRAAIGGYLNIPSELINIILSEYQFISLCRVWKLLANKFHPESIEVTKKIFKELLSINTDRVRVAHGLWTPGVDTIEALHITRGAEKVEAFFSEPGELKSLAHECQRLIQEIIGFRCQVTGSEDLGLKSGDS